MRALRNVGGVVKLQECPDPQVGPGQVLVRIQRSAVSTGTELYRLGIANAQTVESMGYISAGIVEDVRDDATGLKRGDRVFAGVGHAELGVVDATMAFPIPDGVDWNHATSCYWAVPALRAVHRLEPRVYDNLAVVGLGAIGLMSLQLLRHVAGRLVAVDIHDVRLAKGQACGADLCVNAAEKNVVEAVGAFLPEGPSRVLDASGTREGLRTALEIVRPRGRVAALRMARDMSGLDFNQYMYFKDITLVAAGAPGRQPDKECMLNREPVLNKRAGNVWPEDWYFRREIQAAMDMIARGYVTPEPIITHEVAPEAAVPIYDVLRDPATRGQYIGVMIDWT